MLHDYFVCFCTCLTPYYEFAESLFYITMKKWIITTGYFAVMGKLPTTGYIAVMGNQLLH